MPQILTGEFAQRVFFLPFSTDKTEGVYVKPVTMTRRRELQHESNVEAGMDADLAMTYFIKKILQESIIDWIGFQSVEKQEVKYSKEVVADLCEHDMLMANTIFERINTMARSGELQEQKN